MQNAGGVKLRVANATEQALAEAWADFSKALAIYPPTNARVQTLLTEFIDRVRTVAGSRSNVGLVWQTDGLRVGDALVASEDGTKAAWLRERCGNALLAGIRVWTTVSQESLVELTRDLVQIGSRAHPGANFEDLWTREYEDLALVEIRFSGSFTGNGMVGYGGTGGGGTNVGAGIEAGVSTILDSSDGVQGRMEALRNLLRTVGDNGVSQESDVNLLNRILSMLSPEVLADEEAMVKAVESVMDRMANAVESWDPGTVMPESALSQLISSVGKRMFVRDDHDFDLFLRPEGPKGKGRDDDILEDPDELLEAYRALPTEGAENDRFAEEAQLVDEQVWSYLFYLATAVDPSRSPAVRVRLAELLADPDDRCLEILRYHLQDAIGGQKFDPDNAPALVEALRSTGLMHLLRRCGIASADGVVEEFPAGFMLFMDSLDVDVPGDVEQLQEVVRAIGPERIRGGQKALDDDGGFGSEKRSALVLARPALEMMPFVRMFAHTAGSVSAPTVVRYLRGLGLSEREMTPLTILGQPERLPFELLMGLLARNEVGRYPKGVADLVDKALMDFVLETKRDESQLKRRVYALTMLGTRSTPDTRRFLKGLLCGEGFLRLRREPALLRKTVQSLLEGKRDV